MWARTAKMRTSHANNSNYFLIHFIDYVINDIFDQNFVTLWNLAPFQRVIFHDLSTANQSFRCIYFAS